MPLEHGSSEEAIGHNISEMEAAGHPHDQAVAAALNEADEAKKKDKRELVALYLLSQQYQ